MESIQNPSTSLTLTSVRSHPLKPVSVQLERLSVAQINALRASLKVSRQDLSVQQQLCKERSKRKHSEEKNEERIQHKKSKKLDKHEKKRRDSEKLTVAADTVQSNSDAKEAIVHFGKVESPHEKQAGDGDRAEKVVDDDNEVKYLSHEKSESGYDAGSTSRDGDDVNITKSKDHSETESKVTQNSETNERIIRNSESDEGNDEALESRSTSSRSETKLVKNTKKKHNYDIGDTGSEAGSSDYEKEDNIVKSEDPSSEPCLDYKLEHSHQHGLESSGGEDSGSEVENVAQNSEINEKITQDSESDDDSDDVSKTKKLKKEEISKSCAEMKNTDKKKLLKMIAKKQTVTKAHADSSSNRKGWMASKSASAWDSLEQKLQLFMKMEAMQRKVESSASDLPKIGKIKKKTNNPDDRGDSILNSPLVSSTCLEEDKRSSGINRSKYRDGESYWTSDHNRRPEGDGTHGTRMDGFGRFRSHDDDRSWNQGRPGRGRQNDTWGLVRDHKREGLGKSEINKFTTKDKNSHHFDIQLQKSGGEGVKKADHDEGTSGQLSQDDEDAGWFDAGVGDHDDDSDYERSGQETSKTGIGDKEPNDQEDQVSKDRSDISKHRHGHSLENRLDHSLDNNHDHSSELQCDHHDHGLEHIDCSSQRHKHDSSERRHSSESRGQSSERFSHKHGKHVHNSRHNRDHSSEHHCNRSGSGHQSRDRFESSSNRRHDRRSHRDRHHDHKQRDNKAYQGDRHNRYYRGWDANAECRSSVFVLRQKMQASLTVVDEINASAKDKDEICTHILKQICEKPNLKIAELKKIALDFMKANAMTEEKPPDMQFEYFFGCLFTGVFNDAKDKQRIKDLLKVHKTQNTSLESMVSYAKTYAIHQKSTKEEKDKLVSLIDENLKTAKPVIDMVELKVCLGMKNEMYSFLKEKIEKGLGSSEQLIAEAEKHLKEMKWIRERKISQILQSTSFEDKKEMKGSKTHKQQTSKEKSQHSRNDAKQRSSKLATDRHERRRQRSGSKSSHSRTDTSQFVSDSSFVHPEPFKNSSRERPEEGEHQCTISSFSENELIHFIQGVVERLPVEATRKYLIFKRLWSEVSKKGDLPLEEIGHLALRFMKSVVDERQSHGMQADHNGTYQDHTTSKEDKTEEKEEKEIVVENEPNDLREIMESEKEMISHTASEEYKREEKMVVGEGKPNDLSEIMESEGEMINYTASEEYKNEERGIARREPNESGIMESEEEMIRLIMEMSDVDDPEIAREALARFQTGYQP